MQKLRFKNKKWLIPSYLNIAATIESNPASAILCLSAFICKICLTYFVVGPGHTLGLISYSGSVNTKPSWRLFHDFIDFIINFLLLSLAKAMRYKGRRCRRSVFSFLQPKREVLICYPYYHLIFAVKCRGKRTIKQKIYEICDALNRLIIHQRKQPLKNSKIQDDDNSKLLTSTTRHYTTHCLFQRWECAEKSLSAIGEQVSS